ncbi:hypothetical protein TURU_019759 [Turdus rufiventris]|nr:hypothetical protein TURU_019759 [Turdus rufiventris]
MVVNAGKPEVCGGISEKFRHCQDNDRLIRVFGQDLILSDLFLCISDMSQHLIVSTSLPQLLHLQLGYRNLNGPITGLWTSRSRLEKTFRARQVRQEKRREEKRREEKRREEKRREEKRREEKLGREKPPVMRYATTGSCTEILMDPDRCFVRQ